ncbi:MAG: FMN-binding protein [Bacillus subtilis]|nr:FMN-binding protein [Bacillus subtilis]
MKEYLKMIVFVLIMGILTSGLLVGMDALTAERIAENESADIKTTIMDAYGIAYTTTNLHDVFQNSIDVVTSGEYTFYVDRVSGAVSFEFIGGGVWGPISGVITLKSDFVTIQSIAVLDQEETPGLGGRIAEPDILGRFVNIVLDLNGSSYSSGGIRFWKSTKTPRRTPQTKLIPSPERRGLPIVSKSSSTLPMRPRKPLGTRGKGWRYETHSFEIHQVVQHLQRRILL